MAVYLSVRATFYVAGGRGTLRFARALRSWSCAIVSVVAVAMACTPEAVAHRGDGIFRLAEGRWLNGVWGNWLAPDPAMLSDGSVLMVAEERAWRIRLDGQRSVVSGLGGTGVTATTDGGAFVVQGPTSDFTSPLGVHRIVHWSPATGVRVVAGTGDPGLSGDGGPAIRAQINLGKSEFGPSLGWDEEAEPPNGIVASPDGGFVFADTGNGRIRAVDAAGVIRTVAGSAEGTLRDPLGLAAAPDQGYVVSENGWPGFGKTGLPPRLMRLTDGGTVETLLPASWSTDVAVAPDGTVILGGGIPMTRLRPGSQTPEPLFHQSSALELFDFAARPWPFGSRIALGPGGDLLMAGNGTLSYVPAGPTPWTLVALRQMRTSRAGVTAVIETTQPGSATFEIVAGDRVDARVSESVAAGHSTLSAPGRPQAEWYDARVVLNGANGLTWRDEVPVYGGRALTVEFVRRLLGRHQGKSGSDDGATFLLDPNCRRFGPRRVDCAVLARVLRRPDERIGVVSVTLRRSGVVLRRHYDWERRGFRRHPQYDAMYGVRRLSEGREGRWPR